jgi:hypothetical protein
MSNWMSLSPREEVPQGPREESSQISCTLGVRPDWGEEEEGPFEGLESEKEPRLSRKGEANSTT